MPGLRQTATAPSVQQSPRGARPTLRCLTEDLGLTVPKRDVDLGALDHAVLDKAREFAPSFPQNQTRIQAITDTMVYRFTFGRYRVADWEGPEDRRPIWVCAAELRRQGASDDAYEYFIALHAADELLPGEEDDFRWQTEAGQRVVDAIRIGAAQWVADARSNEGRERPYELPGGATIYLYVRHDAGYEEIWLAMPTLLANVVGLTPPMREFLTKEIEAAVGDAEWDDAHDWPTRRLREYELARFGLR